MLGLRQLEAVFAVLEMIERLWHREEGERFFEVVVRNA